MNDPYTFLKRYWLKFERTIQKEKIIFEYKLKIAHKSMYWNFLSLLQIPLKAVFCLKFK